MENFTPIFNRYYGISFHLNDSQDGVLYLTGSDTTGKLAYNTREIIPDGTSSGAGFGNSYLWVFMPIANGCYLLVNYISGGVLKTTNNNTNLKGGDDLEDNTAVVMPVVKNDKVCLYLKNALGYICLSNDGEEAFGLTQNINEALEFGIVDSGELPYFPAEISASKPAVPQFVNGCPPPVYPVEADCVINTVYVPFPFVKDNSYPTYKEQSRTSPYYILRQYGQYNLLSNLRNDSIGSVTFVEDWQTGWSSSQSASFSDQLGVSIGAGVEMNEIFVKETFSGTINSSMGITNSKSESDSGSNSIQIRGEVPANSSLAIYGLSTNYQLFRMNETSPLPAYSDPMQMSYVFLTIGEMEE